MIPEKIKYPSINGLRALSIMVVICQHLSLHFGVFARFESRAKLRPFIEFLRDGQMGVSVFFVISGFLITTLMLQEEAATGRISLKDFYIRRTLRIFPAYYFFLLVLAVLDVSGILKADPIPPSSWLSAVTYTKYLNWHQDWWTAHAWSLSIEEHFYLLWPLVFICGPAVRKRVVVAILLIVPLFRLYIFYHPISWVDEQTIFIKLDVIATGCFFALFQQEIKRFLAKAWTPFFLLAALSLFLLKFSYPLGDAHHFTQAVFMLGESHGILASFLVGIILMYSVFGPQGLWFRILNLRLVNYIGVLSYSIYLWQQLFVSHLPGWEARFPQNIAVTLMAAMLSYHLIERPFLRLKSRFSRLREQKSFTTTSPVSDAAV